MLKIVFDLQMRLNCFRCEDHRCMDPSVCCDPNLDPSCNVLRDCCIPIIETGRQFYKLGIEKRKSQDLEFLHSTVTVIIGLFLPYWVSTCLNIQVSFMIQDAWFHLSCLCLGLLSLSVDCTLSEAGVGDTHSEEIFTWVIHQIFYNFLYGFSL